MVNTIARKQPVKFIFIAVIILSTIMRLWKSMSFPLWHDEAFSALLIRMPFAEMMQSIGLDVHPPFYYWLLRAWSEILGHSVFALRSFSIVFGVATVIAVYFLVKEISKSERLALGAAALLALNPFHIQYSLEIRMYTLGTFLIVLSSWVLLRALKNNGWNWWIAYTLITVASALNHYFMLFSIAAQGIFALVWWLKRRKPLFSDGGLRWLWSYLIALVLYIPWLPTFWYQFNQVQANYWIPEMDRWSIPTTVWKILLGGFEGQSHPVLLITTLVFLALLFFYVKKYRSLEHEHLPYMAVIPFVLATLVSLQTSLFMDRYFIFASVFIVPIVAMSILSLHWKKVGMILFTILLIANPLYYASALNRLNIDEKPGISAAAYHLLGERSSCGARDYGKIIISSTFIYFSYQYYDARYRDLCPHEPIKPNLYLPDASKVDDLPHFSGTALLENEELVGNLNEFASEGEIVWLLWTTGFGGSKPEVPQSWVEMEEKKYPDVFEHRGDIYVTEYYVN